MATKDDVLKQLDKTIESLGNMAAAGPLPGVPEEVTALAPIGLEAYRLVREIMASGHDPVVVIARMREAKPWLDGAEADWRKAMDRKFGAQS